MSRIDTHEFEYPPGLGSLRNRGVGEREPMHGYYSGAFGSQDRRPSIGVANYGVYGGAVPRSLGMQEQDFGFGMGGVASGPNRHNPNASNPQIPVQPFSSFNHHSPHRPSPPPAQAAPYTYTDHLPPRHSPAANLPPPTAFNHSRSTLWWGEIEPWMDEEYAKQVCGLMGWDPVNIKVPHPAPDPATGQQANNPGYCFLTFPTPAHAAYVLAQINNGGNGAPVMPNSSKPFVLNWASSVAATTPMSSSFPSGPGAVPGTLQQYPKEYSIFVGDLAPETSNSDLVAVFRNPVLGLRNDREPKFIRPFLSCKSAKIMLDPVTGVSRGYGFVRFTDETDQQRALIEMHGLYCLSRPMRISPATAKFKPPPTLSVFDLPQVQFPGNANGFEQKAQPVTIALPLPSSNQTKSVSAPIAATTPSNPPLNNNGVSASGSGSGSSLGGSNSTNSLSSGTASSASISSSAFGSMTSDEMMNLPNSVLAQIAQQYANGDTTPIKVNGSNSITSTFVQDAQLSQGQGEDGAPRYTISEESWKHHAQARAILGNLIGPNGEQLTSTDPYNTTVFVGGLSPLISEETLRTFFAPFGDIHYVKVPVGKHCGFVQFVRKADAERAIEKMQGFPVGGSRIRLSWGRSQYKAAQAAAQAAQAAALQTQFPLATVPPTAVSAMSQGQALQLLQKFSMQGYLNNVPDVQGNDGPTEFPNGASTGSDPILRSSMLGPRDGGPQSFESYANTLDGQGNAPVMESRQTHSQSTFSPFSPDPNFYASEVTRRDSASFSRAEMLPHPSKAFAPGFFPLQTQDPGATAEGGARIARVSPTSSRPPSATRYGSFLETTGPSFHLNRVPGRPEAPISRPPSGSMPSHKGQEGPEFNAMHDLNGTLASLDLDRSWKSSTESSGSDNAPVQFRMTMETSP